jgi:nucleoside-diphosphate-sugar epimerase
MIVAGPVLVTGAAGFIGMHVARRLLADGDMSAIFQSGLHEFLAEFIARNNRLGNVISSTYHFTD